MPLLRPGTFDYNIWCQAENEYATLPVAFGPGEIVLDVGCHTGAVCELAARRGATVIGFEASWQNYGLAVLNTLALPEVILRYGAVWRSDVATDCRTFSPSADTGNTGGGSVLFATDEDHWAARPSEGEQPAPQGTALQKHEVTTIRLDDVLMEFGHVRFLKLDVEGAEFPILLTSHQLGRVSELGGEYHELDDAGMERLAAAARVGSERYTGELLRRCLHDAGFEDVAFRPTVSGRGLFFARRRRVMVGPFGKRLKQQLCR